MRFLGLCAALALVGCVVDPTAPSEEWATTTVDGKGDGEENGEGEAADQLTFGQEEIDYWATWLRGERARLEPSWFEPENGRGYRWYRIDISQALRDEGVERIGDLGMSDGCAEWASRTLHSASAWSAGHLYEVTVPNDRPPAFWWERGRSTLFAFNDGQALANELSRVIDVRGDRRSFNMRNEMIVDAAILERAIERVDRGALGGERTYQLLRVMLAQREEVASWLSGGD